MSPFESGQDARSTVARADQRQAGTGPPYPAETRTPNIELPTSNRSEETPNSPCQMGPDGFNHAKFVSCHQPSGRSLDMKPARTFSWKALDGGGKDGNL